MKVEAAKESAEPEGVKMLGHDEDWYDLTKRSVMGPWP